MAAPRTEPCADWATLDDVRGCPRCSDVDRITDDAITDALGVASGILFELSGRRFSGVCTATERPCRRPVGPTPSGWAYGAYGAPWGWCACTSGPHASCGCPALSEVELTGSPIVSVTTVKVDGTTLTDGTDYRVDDYRYLVRLNDERWPCCSDLTADPDTDLDTFEVTYTYGLVPPAAGVRAAIDLACELARACADLDCELPERVQTISRQGVTMALLDPFEFFTQGRVGVYSADMFLAAYNPGKLRRAAAIHSPDIGNAARRTGT